MSSIWPRDVIQKTERSADDALRGLRCILLMPFKDEFAPIAHLLRETVERVVRQCPQLSEQPPEVDRLDWANSSAVIHSELWERIARADLVFCDITGCNPNVMFEYGVYAAAKRVEHVVLIKNRADTERSPFNISPIRYFEYELTNDGLAEFVRRMEDVTLRALIGLPDPPAPNPQIALPLDISFTGNYDDPRVHTPSPSHRRVIDETLEFGSRYHYRYSWASIGKEHFRNFKLEFVGRFSNPLPNPDAWIGVGLRSQHPWAGHGHIFYLRRDGQILLCSPDDTLQAGFQDVTLRDAQGIDHNTNHEFEAMFDDTVLSVRIDDTKREFPVRDMKKVFGPGLIRFQSCSTWMAIKHITLEPL